MLRQAGDDDVCRCGSGLRKGDLGVFLDLRPGSAAVKWELSFYQAQTRRACTYTCTCTCVARNERPEKAPQYLL